MITTGDPSSVRNILKYIDVVVILHNLLLDLEDEALPDEWYQGWEVVDHTGDPALEAAIQANEPKDSRRTKLLDYLRDYVYGY